MEPADAPIDNRQAYDRADVAAKRVLHLDRAKRLRVHAFDRFLQRGMDVLDLEVGAGRTSKSHQRRTFVHG